jgi:phage tail-like protein
MSFNLDFLYERGLPAHMRQDDEDIDFFLKRFLSHFCLELDDYDQIFDTFHELIAPETATEEFLNWWLWALFGWAWFPDWFTLEMKRNFYRDIATHYARRGTARGIKEFLAAFGIRAQVITLPVFYGEWTTGQDTWSMTGPLNIIVRIFPYTAGVSENLSFYGEWTTGEDVIADPALVIERPDIDALLRFQQPVGQHIIIEELVA